MVDLRRIIREEIEKFILSERISSKVYHFTNIPRAYNILSKNTMYLQSSVGGVGSDNYGGKMFYMSLTRNKNTNFSYANNYDGRESGVRIEFDGDKLNQRFKGFPIDYWGGSMGKMSYFNKTRGDKIEAKQRSNETEDRIVSNESVIRNISDYIVRVDIFALNEKYLKQAQVLKQIPRWCEKIFIYDNLKDFNYQTDNVVNVEWDFDATIPQNRESNRSTIITALGRFFYLQHDDWYQTSPKERSKEIFLRLKQYGLENFMNKSVLDAIQKTIHGWSQPNEKVFDLMADMKNIASDTQSDDGQKVVQMISDYMRENGYKSGRDWAIAVTPKDRNEEYKNLDTDKLIKVVVYTWKDSESVWNARMSANPNEDSFWDLINYKDFGDRMFFLEEIYVRREERYDYYHGVTIPASYQHNSKSDEHFYKYLQHLAKNEVPISKMLKILKKLNVPLDDENLFRGKEITFREINYWDAPENIREGGYFKKS